ncbi:hypothetical protein DSO57_1023261 [Entomophthora muscae]|uniref:Uncharacterized protein n=1 Tax=Entomophthora muscae TaxID=34485 RepID=A0ACC2RTV7_9FUNG|nr:hypothetical protein DSO57_1023261 [Entomophthora muscae]
MIPPITLWPDCPQELGIANETTFTQLFGAIELYGPIQWSLLGQSFSYILKLAPILWWALVMNAAIHHALISPLLGYFEDESLSFAFALQNEAGFKLGNTIVQFPDPAQLTCPTHACDK